MLRALAAVAVLAMSAVVGCGSDGAGAEEGRRLDGPTDAEEGRPRMALTSPAFEHGGLIPAAYTCDGKGVSPPLNVAGVPAAARSLALICDDPDSPSGCWTHWLVWNIPPGTSALAEGKEPPGTAGANSWREADYGGPCPPSGVHTYRFLLCALDVTLELPAGSDREAVDKAMAGHVLAEARLDGRYSRPAHR